ncbi:MAG: hypothetical protein WD770_09405 [Actinomycetota bacterium]
MRRARSVLAAICLLAAGCAERDPSPPAAGGPSWERLSDSPLGPRHSALAFWTGERVLILGGRDTQPCHPAADCTPPPEPALRDGAEWDPATGAWRRIADAPVSLEYASGTVLDGVLYLLVHPAEAGADEPERLFSFDPSANAWDELPRPPDTDRRLGRQALAAGDILVAYWPTQELGVHPDLVYDPAAREWRELPADPIVPSFDRNMVWTGSEVVLTGIESVPQPGSDGPALYRAASLDPGSATWTRFPDSPVTGYSPIWFWAGERVVNGAIGVSDGGEVGGWERPYPHGGMLDPATGTWSALPDPPEEAGPYPGPSATNGVSVLAGNGWILHVPSGTWRRLSRPPETVDVGEAVVWAGDRIVVWGGARWNGAEAALVAEGWSYPTG